MDTDDLVLKVEQFINGEADKPDVLISNNDNELERYLKRTVIRLINTYEEFLKGDAGKSDYLCDLRNFMLSFKTYMTIDDGDLLLDNHFGIRQASNGYQYYNYKERISSFVFVPEEP